MKRKQFSLFHITFLCKSPLTPTPPPFLSVALFSQSFLFLPSLITILPATRELHVSYASVLNKVNTEERLTL